VKRSICFILAVGALLSIGSNQVTAGATRLIEGEIDGADFQIGLPAKWSGGLVLFGHGYQGEGAARGAIYSSPLAQHLVEHGQAWAASGFWAMGYRPDWFVPDILALRAGDEPGARGRSVDKVT
jgi:hypothetical protein